MHKPLVRDIERNCLDRWQGTCFGERSMINSTAPRKLHTGGEG
jgi:hypothetical protein